jgi:hypothetical protein
MRIIGCGFLGWLGLAILIAQLSVAVTALGQSNRVGPISGSWHFRYDLFQMLLEERGLRVLPGLDAALARPRESVIVIAGNSPRQFVSRDWEQLDDFVQLGGALLFATDASFDGVGFGRCSAGPVTSPNPADQYQGFADCLQIRLTDAAQETLTAVSRIVTNRSGWFVPDSLSLLKWDVLVSLPSACRPVASIGFSDRLRRRELVQ